MGCSAGLIRRLHYVGLRRVKEKCQKRWVKNRVVAIRKVVNCDSGDIYKELQTQQISQQGFVM